MNMANAKKTKEIPNDHFSIIQNRFFAVVLSSFPQYWAINAPPALTTVPVNRFITNTI